jgi:uncharacterized protein with PQ loop repeat
VVSRLFACTIRGRRIDRRLDAGALPEMTAIFGSGQLMLTSVALLGNGVRELSSAEERPVAAEFLTWSASIFLFIIATAYGYTVKDVVIQNQVTHQSEVVVASFIFLAFSLVVAGVSIGVTTPTAPRSKQGGS